MVCLTDFAAMIDIQGPLCGKQREGIGSLGVQGRL